MRLTRSLLRYFSAPPSGLVCMLRCAARSGHGHLRQRPFSRHCPPAPGNPARPRSVVRDCVQVQPRMLCLRPSAATITKNVNVHWITVRYYWYNNIVFVGTLYLNVFNRLIDFVFKNILMQIYRFIILHNATTVAIVNHYCEWHLSAKPSLYATRLPFIHYTSIINNLAAPSHLGIFEQHYWFYCFIGLKRSTNCR